MAQGIDAEQQIQPGQAGVFSVADRSYSGAIGAQSEGRRDRRRANPSANLPHNAARPDRPRRRRLASHSASERE